MSNLKPIMRRDEISPAVNFNKRPSYLESSLNLPGNHAGFDEGVIRRLEPQFNEVIEGNGEGQDKEGEEEEEEEFEQIKTYLRIRPYIKKAEDEAELIEIKDDRTVIASCGVPGTLGKKTNKRMEFKFTKVLDPSCSQEQVYEEAIEPLLENFDNGENCLIFSYGSTNSGKTYTMRGSATKYGIIPRTLYHIFDRYQDRIYKGGDVQPFRHESTRELLPDQYKILLDKKKLLLLAATDTMEMKHRPKIRMSMSTTAYTRKSDASSHCTSVRYIGGALPLDMDNNRSLDTSVFGMWVSFVELYNEKCFDLLSYGRRNEVKIVSEKGGYSYFKDVVELPVFSEEEAFAIYVAGCNKLEVSATLINQTSSRSHSFFTIRVVELGRTSESVYPIKVHRMTFGDLAGCERAKQTENTGGQLRESANINQSLLSLLRVIRMIRNKQSHSQAFLEKIPFRDSKLTRIFQGYFTTATHIAMIVNINPVPKMVDSSIQTLINSAIASNIVVFRSRPSTQSVVTVEHAPCNLSFHHSSVDLEDVIEETEEEVDEEENRPLPVLVRQVSLSYQPAATESTVATPLPLSTILKTQNIIIGSPISRRKNVAIKVNDSKNLKSIEIIEIEKENIEDQYQGILFENQRLQDNYHGVLVANHRLHDDYQGALAENQRLQDNYQGLQVEYQRLHDNYQGVLVENERLRDNYEGVLAQNQHLQNKTANLSSEITKRDRSIKNLNDQIKTVEAETREEMLIDMDARMRSIREQEQRSYKKKLEFSDQKANMFRSRMALEGKKTVATQTDTTTN